MATLFERLAEGRPAPSEPTPQTTPLPALKLLNWLQRGWGKPTISAKNLYQYGPSAIRDKKSARDAAEALERRGWLAPIKKHRYDGKKWRIMQGFD